MARLYFSLRAAVLLILTLALGASRSSSQREGFYSINCGGDAYTDRSTKIVWEADPLNNSNSEAGRAATISSNFKNITNVMKTLRYFPNDSGKNKKFCYPLTVSNEGTYLLRVSFLYGNYDGLNKPPKFLVILNYDVWTNVTTSSLSTPVRHELIFIYNNYDLNICVAPHLNSNDTPFISTIEIRQLNKTMYYYYPSSALSRGYGLMLWRRIDYGATTKTEIRYPDDPYDRIWEADTTGPTLQYINASELGSHDAYDPEQPPAAVMATAITSSDPQGNLSFTYDGYGGDDGFRIEPHFEELDQTASSRSFELTFPNSEFSPFPVTLNRSFYFDDLITGFPLNLQIIIFPLAASQRGPLLNAIELFRWTPQRLATIRTFQHDVEVIQEIQANFNLMGDGQGDPCMPEGYAWTWIVCNMDSRPRIIEINLSSFNLTGGIPSSINNLTNLQKLDLSNNKLSGGIPNVNNLLDLKYLDLHNNNLIGELPSSLISLPQLTKLDVSYNNLCGTSPSFQAFVSYNYTANKRLCDDSNCSCSSSMSASFSVTTNLPKTKKNTRKYIVTIILLGGLYIASIITLTFLKAFKARQHIQKKQKLSTSTILVAKKGVDDLKDLPLVTKLFTYSEICDATLNFTTILGEGGFGKVYHGVLPSGEEVAVKILLDASKQGLKEFYNEVAILSRVRHKNLVSLVGYCVENTYMLVYEYIAKGNLRNLLYGELDSIDKPLSWMTRLHIALDASQGLEYLHSGCDPTVIHRDVKSTNILLSEKMQAKVSDFGLSRLKEEDNTTSHVSTINVVGTIGYLDPAYNATNQLTHKSDVYSFGIVLFELICGRAPIEMLNNPPHIVDWASQSIAQGKVKEIVDPMLANGFKMESMWRVINLALGCVDSDRMKRPIMRKVSEILQSSLEIEKDPNYSQDVSSSSTSADGKLPTFHYYENLQV